MSDCRFYVNEPERTIVCVIPNTKRMVLDFITDNCPDLPFWVDDKLYDKICLPHSFSGKAVCAEEDEWNEELGRMIAFSRAKNKCYKSFFKRANTYVQSIDRKLGDTIETFNDFGLKLEGKREALETKIEKAMGTIVEE